MKKVLSLTIVIVIIAALFAGCKESPTQESQPVKENKVESNKVNDDVQNDDEEIAKNEATAISIVMGESTVKEGLDAIIALVKEELNMTVEYDIIGGAGLENMLKTRLATGDMGDIFINNPGAQMNVLNPELNMVDLSDELWASKLDKGFVDVASYNGKLYGAPLGSSMVAGIFYNKKLYEELGLKVPTTWAEFLDNCDVVNAAGKIALLGSYKDTWSAQIIFLGDYYNIYTAEPNFAEDFTNGKSKYASTPAGLRSWEKLADSKDYMNEDYLATTVDTAIEMFAAGDAAHWPMLTVLVPAITDINPDFENDIGIFPILGDDSDKAGFTAWPSNTLHIYIESPNIEAAKKFLGFYYSDEGLAAYSAEVKAFGPYHIVGMEMGDNIFPFVNDIAPFFADGKVTSAIEFVTPVKGPSCPQISVTCGSGMETPKESAAKYDKDCEKQAVQLGLEGWQD